MDDKASHARGPRISCPRGRHNLGRRYVEGNQRERILDAVADVTSLAGYVAMSVEEVIGTAGVSRRTFYDTFASKEDAFPAAPDGVVEDLVGRVRAACDANETLAAGVRDGWPHFSNS